jgi:hypothetical protein
MTMSILTAPTLSDLPETLAVSMQQRGPEVESPGSFVCDLWMTDPCGSTVLRCRCVECSPGRMRLQVPLGYGVAVGQHYELWTHPPEASSRALAGLMDRRWARVAQARLCLDQVEDHLDVTMEIDSEAEALTHSLPGPVS